MTKLNINDGIEFRYDDLKDLLNEESFWDRVKYPYLLVNLRISTCGLRYINIFIKGEI
ncbi:MAG: hypothetical protein JSV49_09945 [Thermoplasmata archaeon]|nr:MAG: hypothetical protein JSV49_09945 [Thermoplasmata archaeon]